MCQCTPEKRTPYCGAPGCEWPVEWREAMDEMQKEPVILPEIGDIVLYNVDLAGDSEAIRNNGASVLPAIVVMVWSADCVNLKVLCDGPTDAWVTSVVRGVGPGQWIAKAPQISPERDKRQREHIDRLRREYIIRDDDEDSG